MKDCCCYFELEFEEESQEFCLDFGEIQIVNPSYDPYEGPYVVIPKRRDQVLATKDKDMTDDVTVKEIPWTEVSNPTGITFTIAAD